MPTPRRNLIVDGKVVRIWLFCHVIKNDDGTNTTELVQVEAFAIDHAIKRLREAYPGVPSAKWGIIQELDPEHDVGALGRKLPLLPNVVRGSRLIS